MIIQVGNKTFQLVTLVTSVGLRHNVKRLDCYHYASSGFLRYSLLFKVCEVCDERYCTSAQNLLSKSFKFPSHLLNIRITNE